MPREETGTPQGQSKGNDPGVAHHDGVPPNRTQARSPTGLFICQSSLLFLVLCFESIKTIILWTECLFIVVKGGCFVRKQVLAVSCINHAICVFDCLHVALFFFFTHFGQSV